MCLVSRWVPAIRPVPVEVEVPVIPPAGRGQPADPRGRRNLSAYERTKLALRLEEAIAGRAKQRMKAGKTQDPSQKSEQGKTSQEIAKAAGVSHDTVATRRGARRAL